MTTAPVAARFGVEPDPLAFGQGVCYLLAFRLVQLNRVAVAVSVACAGLWVISL
jgi:hypothetical protein